MPGRALLCVRIALTIGWATGSASGLINLLQLSFKLLIFGYLPQPTVTLENKSS